MYLLSKNMKKRIISIIILVSAIVILTPGCSSVKATGKVKRYDMEEISVAILPFYVTNVTWGDEFADAVGFHLRDSGKFRIVERSELSKIIKEQSISQTGMISDKDRLQIGKIHGVQYLIMGRGTAKNYTTKDKEKHNKLVDTFTLNMVDVETGEVVLTARKAEGRAWTAEYRAKYILSGSLIWDKDDILVESTTYDSLANTLADYLISKIEWPKENK
jgi:curli biogenesis system outer membrane secretion channel CsgG